MFSHVCVIKKNSLSERMWNIKKKKKLIYDNINKKKLYFLIIIRIYNYICNQCLSPLMSWVWISLRRGVLDTTLCDKVCQWLAAGLWFSLGTPVSTTSETDHHDMTRILLKVALNSLTLALLICNLDIFHFISLSDIISINELSVILKINGQCHIKHIMVVTHKNNNVSLGIGMLADSLWY